MRSIIIILIVAVVMFGAYKMFKPKSPDFIIPWQPVEFTYKTYSGTPSIDSREFYKIVMSKNAQGSCRPLYTQYKDLPDDKLDLLINKKDTNALMEYVGRKIFGNNYLDSLPSPSQDKPDDEVDKRMKSIMRGDIGKNSFSEITRMAMLGLVEDVYLDELKDYAVITPYAQYFILVKYKIDYKVNKRPSDKQAYLAAAAKLKQSGGYYFGMAIGTKVELEDTGKTDKDIFCEAYYNGCDLFTLKQNYGITCAE